MVFTTRLSFSLGCVVALSAALGTPGRAETAAQKSARSAIAALYVKASQAIMHKDIAPFIAAEAPDFENFSAKGTKMNRAQDLASMSQFFKAAIKIPKMESKILSLTWHGPDVVVKAQNTTVFIMADGKKRVRVETVDISRDFWSHTKQGWQIRQVVHSQGKTWVDGKLTQ